MSQGPYLFVQFHATGRVASAALAKLWSLPAEWTVYAGPDVHVFMNLAQLDALRVIPDLQVEAALPLADLREKHWWVAIQQSHGLLERVLSTAEVVELLDEGKLMLGRAYDTATAAHDAADLFWEEPED